MFNMLLLLLFTLSTATTTTATLRTNDIPIATSTTTTTDGNHPNIIMFNGHKYYKNSECDCPKKEDDGHISPSSSSFWVYVGICGGLVLLAGIMSGLTVGLFSIDPLKLEILQLDTHANEIDKKRAKSLESLLKNHHLLLVTLLIVNAAAMESLPIFLDKLVGPIVAIILSVSFVLLFGEIIPQAVCTKNPLKIGAMFAPVVRVFIIITYPLSWPIAKLLDHLLGHDSSTVLFKRSEVKALCTVLSKERGGYLIHDEVTIMKGALALKEKTVGQCMTKSADVFMLSDDAVLDAHQMSDIMASGYSRIPVYSNNNRNNIKGLALVKRLILVNPSERRRVAEFAVRRPVVVPPSTPMFEMLNIFQVGSSHMALVTNDVEEIRHALKYADGGKKNTKHTGVVLGVITLEDVIEELIQEEVIDETDGPYREMLNTLARRDMGVRKAVSKFKLLLKRRVLQRQLSNPTPKAIDVLVGPSIRQQYKLSSPMRSVVTESLEEAPLLEYHRMEDNDDNQ